MSDAYRDAAILRGAAEPLTGVALDLDILCAALHVERRRRAREEALTVAERMRRPDPGEELPRRVWPSVVLREALVVYARAIAATPDLDQAALRVGLPSGLDLCIEMTRFERVLRARGN